MLLFPLCTTISSVAVNDVRPKYISLNVSMFMGESVPTKTAEGKLHAQQGVFNDTEGPCIHLILILYTSFF